MGSLTAALDQLVELLPQVVAASLVFLLFLGVGQLLARGVLRALKAGRGRTRHGRLFARLLRSGFGLVGLVLGLQILGLTAVAASLLATGGLLAIVLGFAFREIGENLLAGVFLGISRSFEVGDVIESSSYVGKVKEIELRQVWLRASDGRDIFIPSAQIFRNVLINYTRDHLRQGQFLVGIDYSADVPEVRKLLLETTKSVEGVLAEPGAAVMISEFAPQYCELRVLFWVNTEEGPGLPSVRSAVMGVCLQALKDRSILLSSDVTTSVFLTRGSD